MKKQNPTQQKYTFTNQKKCTTTQNKHKKYSQVQSPPTTSGLETERAYSGFGAS